MDLHVFRILNPPPTSLPIPSLCVILVEKEITWKDSQYEMPWLLYPSLPPSFKCPVLFNAALFVMAETVNNLDVYQWEMLR